MRVCGGGDGQALEKLGGLISDLSTAARCLQSQRFTISRRELYSSSGGSLPHLIDEINEDMGRGRFVFVLSEPELVMSYTWRLTSMVKHWNEH